MTETMVYVSNHPQHCVKGMGMMKLFSVADSAEILKLNQINGVEKDEANKENEVGTCIISDPKQ